MGSFSSTPRITNEDTQDDDFELPPVNSAASLLALCQDQLSNLPPLLQRTFIHPHHHAHTQLQSHQQPCIRLMQWNVLSQALGQQNDNFVACPDEALEWQTRRFRMLEEILSYVPDVICLQEVDHYNFLTKTLGSLQYAGIFFPKPDSPCVYIQGNNGPDGCAIFYNLNKFELVKIETRIMEVWHVQSNQVAILVILRLRSTGKLLCFVTTHLKARQGNLLATLRNEQGKDLIDFIRTHYSGCPLIVCGDFNAEPTEPVYGTLVGCRDLKLASSYTSLSNCGEEPPFTTWKIREDGEVCHTIDYVFYSKASLEVKSLLQFPKAEDVGDFRVPSHQYPSDHFSLVCDFLVTSPK